MKGWFHRLAAVCLLAVFLFSVWKIFTIQRGYREAERYYETLTIRPTALPEWEGEPQSAPAEPDFAALREINPDIVAWISCPELGIDYPVVQGKDNSFYLKHLFNGSRSDSGCVFLDCENALDFSDLHSIIYGHNMKDGSMFEPLLAYREEAFRRLHPVISLETPEKRYSIEVFAACTAPPEGENWVLDFPTPGEYRLWLGRRLEESELKSGIDPGGERVITLSTCSYDFQGARFAVMGILREEPTLLS